MDKFTNSQLKTKLTSIASANNADNLQAVFVNVVYQSLVMGNNMPEHIKAVRDSSAPQAFKAALGKYLPLTFNKTKQVYEYSRVRAEKLRTELGIELVNDEYVATIDELAAKLPALFAKAEATEKEFDLHAYCANIQKKLDKEGITNADSIVGIMELLARNPSLIGQVSDLVLAGTTVKAA